MSESLLSTGQTIDWIYQGRRDTPVLEACMKLIAWGPELKHHIGFGYKHFIITHTGKYFMGTSEHGDIISAIQKLPHTLAYVEKTRVCEEQLRILLKDPTANTHEIIQGFIQQLSFFYIARIQADHIYEDPETSQEVKEEITQWRNDPLSFESHDMFLHILSKKEHRKESIIDMLTLNEMHSLLNHHPLAWESIEKRLSNQWSVMLEDNTVLFTERNLEPRTDSDTKHENTPREISGTSVLKEFGIVHGIVGEDILVVEMTRPEMITEMKKFRAIVTNQGGILSHAAVTCRELGIPCIIGTKIATDILKTGTEIEIDTNSGVITIVT